MNNCLILNHNIGIYMTTAIGPIGIILCTPIDNSKWAWFCWMCLSVKRGFFLPTVAKLLVIGDHLIVPSLISYKGTLPYKVPSIICMHKNKTELNIGYKHP